MLVVSCQSLLLLKNVLKLNTVLCLKGDAVTQGHSVTPSHLIRRENVTFTISFVDSPKTFNQIGFPSGSARNTLFLMNLI
jgi:hypothetical protein